MAYLPKCADQERQPRIASRESSPVHARWCVTYWRNVLVAVVLVSFAAAARLSIGPRTVDDAFITLRYARNLAGGVGLVYNPGDRVLGTTTPLFAILLAAVASLPLSLQWAATVFGTLADAGVALLVYQAATTIKPDVRLGILASLMWVFSSGSIHYTTGGMEAGLLCAFVCASAVLLSHKRHVVAIICAALACLVRPEGVIALAFVFALCTAERHRVPWELAGLAFLVLLPWVVFATVYYGSPIPSSILAKSSTYRFPALTAAKSMLGHLVPYVLPMGGARLSRTLKYGALLVMLGSTGAFLLPVLRRWDCSLRLFVGLFPCVYAMLYTVANPAVFEWYAVPLVPFLVVSVVIGSYEVLERLAGDHGDLFRKVMRPTLTMCIIGILVAGMREVRYLWLHDAREGRELAYEVISKELSTRCLADCVVAAPEIGTLGWYIPNARILDTQGLVSPEVIPYRKQALSEITDSADLESLKRISAKVPESLILRFKPTFLVSPDAFTRGLGGSNGFGRSYRLLMREASEIFGSTGIVVYERVPD